MAPEAAGNGLGRLSLVVFSGDYHKVHYALVMASAAAATDRPATLFITHGALLAFAGSRQTPGWHALPADPDDCGAAADDRLRGRGVAGFEELLAACVDLGVRFIACEMGLRAMGLDTGELRSDLPIDIAGVVTLLGEASPTGGMLLL